MILKHEIDVCCWQEIEITTETRHEKLQFKGYSLLIEDNDILATTKV